MYSQFIASPDASESQSQQINAICANATSFEQLIYEITLLPTMLEIVKFKADGRSVVAILIRNCETPQEEEIGHIFLPARKLKKLYGVRTVPNPVKDEDTTNLIRVAWMIARSERLNLPGSMVPGGLVAPPSALPELILSYVLSSFGSAVVSRTHASGIRSVSNEYITLELTCAFPVSGMQQEFFCVPVDQLAGLVEKQLVKQALPQEAVMMN